MAWDNIQAVTGVKDIQELRAKIQAGEIYQSELRRLRHVGGEIMAIFFPMGTTLHEIETNVAKKHKEILAGRMESIRICLERGDWKRAKKIAQLSLPEYDRFSGVRKLSEKTS